MNYPSGLQRLLLCGASSLIFLAIPRISASDSNRPAIHGAVSATAAYSDRYNYLGDTRKNADLNIVEAIVNGSYRFENGLRTSAQLYSYKLADYKDVVLDFANVDYSFNTLIGVRAGRLKRASGLHGDVQDIDIIRPFAFLPLDFYPKTLRPLVASVDGAAVYGNIALGAAGSLNYQAAYGWLPKIDTSSPYIQSVTEAGLNGVQTIDTKTVGILALSWNTPVEGLRLVATGNWTPDIELGGPMRTAGQLAGARSDNRLIPSAFPPGAWDFMVAGRRGSMKGDVSRYTYSAEYTRGDWQYSAEYALNVNEFAVSFPAPLGSSASKTKNESYYFMTTWQAASRVQLGAYYGEGFDDKSDRKGKKFRSVPSHIAYLKDLGLASAFTLNSWALLKAEVHFLNGTKGVSSASNVDATRWKKDWTYFVLKTTLSF
jgi:hypothetical protein